MPVQCLIFMRSQLIDNRLNAQHQELVSQMQTKFQIFLTWPIVEHSIYKGHDGRFQIDIISVSASRSIQIVYDSLESSSFGGKPLEMQHG